MVVPHSLYPELGTVEIDREKCNQCGQCVDICPADALKMEEEKICTDEKSPFGCIACGHCMMVCPNESIMVRGRGMSPADLRPRPNRDEMANTDSLAALMLSRRSVRKFKEKEVEPALLERMVDMAAHGPMGIPPWDVGCAIIHGREKVQELAGEIIKGYEGFLNFARPWVLTLLRPFIKKSTHAMFADFIRPLGVAYVEGYRNGRDLVFYDAPAVLIFHHSPYADTADTTIACTYAMLAAEAMGLGATMIGGAPPIMQRNKALCARFGIPAGNTPKLALIVGYPDTHFKRTVQRKFTHVDWIQ